MSREEFEAIETVNNFLMDMAIETSKKMTLKEISYEEAVFWLNSWKGYRKIYTKAMNEYYNTE